MIMLLPHICVMSLWNILTRVAATVSPEPVIFLYLYRGKNARCL